MTSNELPERTIEYIEQSLVGLAIESWRFSRVFERVLSKLDAGEQHRFVSQYRWFLKKVEESLDHADLKLVNIEGHPFDPGMAATPLNLEEFEIADKLIVDQMLEPIIMRGDGIVKTGTVTLRKVNV